MIILRLNSKPTPLAPLPEGEGSKVQNHCLNHKWVRALLLIIIFILFLTSSAFAFSFVVFGDNRSGDEIFKKLIARVNQEKDIVFAINTGDLTERGKDFEYQKYKKMISKCKVKVYNAIGNHDISGSGKALFRAYFGRPYYSFNFENAHFIILDNVSQDGLGKWQSSWLIGDLINHKKMLNFVFMHKPLFDPSFSFPHYVMTPRETRDNLIQLFKENNVEYVFAGHIHGYLREEKESIVYIITGGAGAPLYLEKDRGGFYHYVKITVEDNQIKEKVVRID